MRNTASESVLGGATVAWLSAALYTAVTGHVLQTRFYLHFTCQCRIGGTFSGYGW